MGYFSLYKNFKGHGVVSYCFLDSLQDNRPWIQPK